MNNIITSTFTINKIDSKTHKKIEFEVNNETNLLKLEFSYSPSLVYNIEDVLSAFEYPCKTLNEQENNTLKENFISGSDKLKNLVTLSLYYKDKYIGCAHRHSENQIIIISSKDSTPGFINTPITAGKWEIVLSFHAVFVDNILLHVNVYN